MSEHQPTPHVNMSISTVRGVTHDLRTDSLLVTHSDNTETEDATSVTELDQIDSKQQTISSTTHRAVNFTAELVVPEVNGSSLSLASSSPSFEKKKRGLFKQLSLNLQYGTFNKEIQNVSE